jgi:hypothetical protein
MLLFDYCTYLQKYRKTNEINKIKTVAKNPWTGFISGVFYTSGAFTVDSSTPTLR